MSDSKKYKVSPDLIKEIVDFLENPFDGTRESIDMLKSKDVFTADEVNKVVAIVGKFPAFAVYKILGQLSSKVEEVDSE